MMKNLMYSLITLFLSVSLLAQETTECENLTFISGGFGDGELQFFVPMEHTINKDSLIISNPLDKKSNDEITFSILSRVNEWNCEQEKGKITLHVQLKDNKNAKAIYIIDFEQEKPIITLDYEDQPIIYCSDVSLKK